MFTCNQCGATAQEAGVCAACNIALTEKQAEAVEVSTEPETAPEMPVTEETAVPAQEPAPEVQ